MKKEKFNLPGAERFTQYMKEKVEGILSVTGPEIGEYDREWIVYLDGKEIGRYNTFGPKPGKNRIGKEYHGRLPGYVNDLVVAGNKYREDKMPIDSVVLIFGNEKCEARDLEEGPGRLIRTHWQRQDGHSGILFP